MDRNKKIGVIILVILILGFSVFAFKWIYYRTTHAVSDAVFVEANTFTDVAYKRDSGRIIALYKKEGDYVIKGEPLAKIDDEPYKANLYSLEFKIKSLEAQRDMYRIQRDRILNDLNLSVLSSEYTKQQASKTAQSINDEVKALDAKISLLEKDKNRYKDLYEKGVIPKHAYEEIDTSLENLLNQKRSLENKALAMKASEKRANISKLIAKNNLKQVKEISQQIKALDNQIKSLKAKEKDLQDMLTETELRSPITGYIVKKFVSIGDVVRAGQPVYAVYDPNSVYILDLLDENKLHGVHVGNKVDIHIDALPNEHYEGVVSEILRASAAKFALIPRDITAGEFTKVAQRIPVKIKITKGNIKLLRVGFSGEVAIKRSSN